MIDLLLDHWEKIAIAVTPILTWLFKTRVYDKLELREKKTSLERKEVNTKGQELDFYVKLIDDMRIQNEEVVARKNREIESIMKKQRKPITELKYHRLFLVCDQVEKKVEDIKFITHGEVDKVKTLMMNLLIQEKLVSVRDVFSDFLDDETLGLCSGNALRNKVSKSLKGLVSNYNDRTKDIYIDIGISDEDANYLIDAYEDYRLPLVNGFLESLDDICTNDDYSSNYDKLNAIYELVALSIYLIPKDVRVALDSVNGRFIKYESITR